MPRFDCHVYQNNTEVPSVSNPAVRPTKQLARVMYGTAALASTANLAQMMRMTNEIIMIPAWRDDVLQPVEKLLAHQLGLRHKAVSIFVMDGTRVLIQQRAMEKYHTPGLWANTCCTHPAWGEDPAVCAVRRLDEELGIKGLTPIYRGQVEYRANVGSGLIEHELVEVYVAHADATLELDLNGTEVMDTRWVEYDDLCADVAANPSEFTPWLAIYLAKHGDLVRPDR